MTTPPLSTTPITTQTKAHGVPPGQTAYQMGAVRQRRPLLPLPQQQPFELPHTASSTYHNGFTNADPAFLRQFNREECTLMFSSIHLLCT